MRLLIATFSYPPNKDGVAMASAACAQALRRQGWTVEVATATAETSSARLSADGEEIQVHGFGISGSNHFRHPWSGQLDSYRQFLLSGSWDAILFEGYSWPLDLAVPLFDRISAKKILISHGYGALVWTPVSRFPFGLGALAFSAIKSLKMLGWIKRVDRWVFLSHRQDFRSFYDHWLARRVRHPGIVVIPNGLDPEICGDPHRFYRAAGVSGQILIFLCVGYFSRGKNQRFALEAYRDAALPNSRLVFIAPASNEWMATCQTAARGTRWPSPNMGVLWLTGQTREATLDAFAGCDIYLSASVCETQPITLLEAMREAKPWIAMKAGCISELPGGQCVSNKQEMVQAIKKIASDSQLRTKMGQSGRNAIESTYSTKIFENAYCRLINGLRHKLS
jgi:glycosyltransferase involved in cell wall biosynthesis